MPGIKYSFFSPLFRVYVRIHVCTMATYLPGVVSLQVIRDGVPQPVTAAPLPLRTATAVHLLFSLLSSAEGLFMLSSVQ